MLIFLSCKKFDLGTNAANMRRLKIINNKLCMITKPTQVCLEEITKAILWINGKWNKFKYFNVHLTTYIIDDMLTNNA